jgi:hypothetical protein
MKPTYRIPYKNMQWVWISDHYDVHLAGLCRVKGELMRFEMPKDLMDRDKLPKVPVFRLSWLEKIHWLKKKCLFEWCIGYHWTYPLYFYKPRKPRWFWKIVFAIYYGKWSMIRRMK